MIIPKGTLVEVFDDKKLRGDGKNDFYTNFLGRQYKTDTSCNTSDIKQLVRLTSTSFQYSDIAMYAWRIRPVKRLESESEEI